MRRSSGSALFPSAFRSELDGSPDPELRERPPGTRVWPVDSGTAALEAWLSDSGHNGRPRSERGNPTVREEMRIL